MCGIAGVFSPGSDPTDNETLVQRMCDRLKHRGPDDQGIFTAGGISMGNRRLSIIDLQTGRQPIGNEDGSIWVVFNGEIYNHQRLRSDLAAKGHTFKTTTDTEVIVHLYEEYGEECLQQLNGMFALALWNSRRNSLFLGRDRVGKKPLVYAQIGERLVFASEIQALLEDRTIPRTIDLTAVDDFMTLGYIPAPKTIYRAIRKLPPAHAMTVEAGRCTIKRYWALRYAPKLRLSESAAIEELSHLIQDATALRMVSDVPIGAFLSGGVDSSGVSSFMAQLSRDSIRTFSIGFDTQAYDERPYARQVAKLIHSRHTELTVTPQLASILPTLIRHFGEPFGDNSAIPTYYLANLARQSVKVALSGDGGDELFGGYPWQAMLLDPPSLMEEFKSTMTTGLDSASICARLRQALFNGRKFSRKLLKRISYRFSPFSANLWTRMITSPKIKKRLYGGKFLGELADISDNPSIRSLYGDYKDADFDDVVFATDALVYLPGDILTKVDIASMANSLEVRSPLLDYRVVEFAARLPTPFKLSGGQTKRILKKVFAQRMPAEWLQREKQGFLLPEEDWLRGELREMLLDLLLGPSAQVRDYFNMDIVAGLIDQHLKKEANNARILWLLLTLEIWHRSR